MSGLGAEIRTGSGTPIVLLHGFGSSNQTWLPIIEKLIGRPIVAYDLPGHAGSLQYPNAGSPGTAAKAIIADLNERGIEKAHIAGHSMGGAIATLIALMNPGLVASLTLLSPGGYGEQINAPLLRRYASAVQAEDIADCLKSMSGPDAAIDPSVAEEMARMRQAQGQIEMLEKIVGIIARDGKQGVIPADGIAGINVPVAVLWGTHDTVLPVEQMASMPSGWKKISIERAGHMLVDEVPEAVTNRLLALAQ
ncbi:MAG: alpha/beta fold hydrolase [Rhizobiaceae bacterium]|nr:alpha/beta fold hydrolase [Rhizobiaceae bacterium]